MQDLPTLNVLIVDDEKEFGNSMAAIFQREGYGVTYLQDPLKAEKTLSAGDFHIMVSDVRMPGLGGMDLLERVRKQYPELAIIMLTGYPTVENAVRAMRMGAENFLTKPILPDVLLEELKRINICFSERQQGESSDPGILVSNDNAIIHIIDQMTTAAQSKAPVLITGESGTGKELIAELLHQKSSRNKGPFIKVNCAALPETLLDSELFGVEKGAYTGADKSRMGKFEAAHGGTLFLDEIGDMSLSTQAKILRVLQDHQVVRIGGHTVINVDLRIVAATNSNLNELLSQGKFREDLYYRLSVVSCYLPPLRERQGDLDLLLNHFLSIYNRVYGKSIYGFDEKTRNLLISHNWPGNVRELKNCVERACLFCDKDKISINHLPAQYTSTAEEVNLSAQLEKMNRQKILEALDQSNGVRKKAAEILEIDRRTLYNRMKRLGIS